MSDKELMNVNIIYQKSKDYNIKHASGAYGGPTPNGEIFCNIFIEYHETPEKLSLEIADDKVSNEKPLFPEGSQRMIRELQCGIIMNPQVALAIGNWMIRHAENIITANRLKPTK